VVGVAVIHRVIGARTSSVGRDRQTIPGAGIHSVEGDDDPPVTDAVSRLKKRRGRGRRCRRSRRLGVRSVRCSGSWSRECRRTPGGPGRWQSAGWLVLGAASLGLQSAYSRSIGSCRAIPTELNPRWEWVACAREPARIRRVLACGDSDACPSAAWPATRGDGGCSRGVDSTSGQGRYRRLCKRALLTGSGPLAERGVGLPGVSPGTDHASLGSRQEKSC
jgi:hypothetical protein